VGLDTFGVFLHLGGSNPIPFTFVTNCAEAIALAGFKKGIDGEVFNVVDDDPPSSRRFLKMYIERGAPVSLDLCSSLCQLSPLLPLGKIRGLVAGQLPPVHNRREWAAFWKRTRYSNEKTKRMLDWTPRVSITEGLSLFFANCRRRFVLKIAIIGCGKIADDHLEQIQRIRECKVGRGLRHGAANGEAADGPISSRALFLATQTRCCKMCKPDVVHITTPPRSHYSLGKLCLENGCHVYIEKPFTVNLQEAEELIELSCRAGLKITVGHDLQFSHVARRLRRLSVMVTWAGSLSTWRASTATI
jgi:hypothetical protein